MANSLMPAGKPAKNVPNVRQPANVNAKGLRLARSAQAQMGPGKFNVNLQRIYLFMSKYGKQLDPAAREQLQAVARSARAGVRAAHKPTPTPDARGQRPTPGPRLPKPDARR